MGLLGNLFGQRYKTAVPKPVSLGTIREVKRLWAGVDELLGLKSPSQLKQAVIKADKIVDLVLREVSVGETAGERLRRAKEAFRADEDYQAVWDAHKVRNALVHEADYEPPHHLCREVVGKFKRGLIGLGVTF